MAGVADPTDWRELRRFVAPALFVLLVFGVYFRSQSTPNGPTSEPGASPSAMAAEVAEFSGQIFGTTFLVKVVSDGLTSGQEQAITAAIRSELDDVDRTMSTWKADSQLSQLNRAPVGEAFAVSPSLALVLGTARTINHDSDGAFDVTVGPLVDRWGFGPDGRPQTAPSDDELAQLRAQVGQQHLILDATSLTATRGVPGLTTDLSAIAKGHGVDRVSGALLALGQRRHMVEIGGEVVAQGTNGQGQPWRIAIEKPDTLARTAMDVVSLRGDALATSGDYRNFIVLDGDRISHTIDPRTGRPVAHALASVSVVARSCMLADAWATALTVLGPVQGLEVANQHGIAALLVVRERDGFVQSASKTWRARYPAP